MTPFRLIDARSAAHAMALLAEHGPTARLIAAGGDLFDLLKEGVAGALRPTPTVLINLGTAGMADVARSGTMLRLGAMATLADLAAHADVRAAAPRPRRSAASPRRNCATSRHWAATCCSGRVASTSDIP